MQYCRRVVSMRADSSMILAERAWSGHHAVRASQFYLAFLLLSRSLSDQAKLQMAVVPSKECNTWQKMGDIGIEVLT